MLNSIFFWISKLAWLIISPDSLLLILLLSTWLLLQRGSYRLAKQLHTLLAVVCLLIAFFPVGEWLLSPLENSFPTNPALPHRIDGIVVLGGAQDPVLSAQWQQVEMGDGAERDQTFIALARQYPHSKLIFTGSSGSMINQSHKEADVAKMLFHKMGLNLSRVIFERKSRNTYENAIYSKIIATPKPGENWILITSAYHMPRSMGIFAQAGWPMIPYPVDHRTRRSNLFRIDLDFSSHLNNLKIATKEWLGLTAYRLSGKTTTLWPQQESLPATTKAK